MATGLSRSGGLNCYSTVARRSTMCAAGGPPPKCNTDIWVGFSQSGFAYVQREVTWLHFLFVTLCLLCWAFAGLVSFREPIPDLCSCVGWFFPVEQVTGALRMPRVPVRVNGFPLQGTVGTCKCRPGSVSSGNWSSWRWLRDSSLACPMGCIGFPGKGCKRLLEPKPRAGAHPVTKAGDTVDPSRGNNFYATACSEGSHEVGSPKPMQLSIFRLSGDTSQFCLGGMLVT